MGLVYLLMTNDGLAEMYKIGITRSDVNKRIKSLQTGNSLKIEVLHTYETPNYKLLERWLHSRFNMSKTQADNEWFYIPNADVLAFKDICKKGDNIISMMLRDNPFFKA